MNCIHERFVRIWPFFIVILSFSGTLMAQSLSCDVLPINVVEDYLDTKLSLVSEDTLNCIYQYSSDEASKLSLKISGPYQKKDAKVNYANLFSSARTLGAISLRGIGGNRAFFGQSGDGSGGNLTLVVLSGRWILQIDATKLSRQFTRKDAVALLKRHVLKRFKKYQKLLSSSGSYAKSCGYEEDAPIPEAKIESSKEIISKGESVTFSWSGWEACRCEGSPELNVNGATRGSIVLYPSESKGYYVQCYGPGGVHLDTVTVRVFGVLLPPPEVSFTADKSIVTPGEVVTFNLVIKNLQEKDDDKCYYSDILFTDSTFENFTLYLTGRAQVFSTQRFGIYCAGVTRSVTIQVVDGNTPSL